jgi:hypothetical protein
MNRSVVAGVVVAGLVGLTVGAAAYARFGPGSAGLDAGAAAALSLFLSVAIAACVGAGGAIGGASIAARAARDAAAIAQGESQADRDDSRTARAAERADAQADRYAERKVTLAVALLVAADLHRRQTDQRVVTAAERWQSDLNYGPPDPPYGPLPEIDTTEPIRAAMLALTLVAPTVETAAVELYLATVQLGPMAIRWPNPDREGANHNDWMREWAAATASWDDARLSYVDRVRSELGVNRPPMTTA